MSLTRSDTRNCRRKMKIAIFNVKYSPNLGDGVIALCLENSIRDRTGWSVLSIDLAGRSNYASSGPDISRLLKLSSPENAEAVEGFHCRARASKNHQEAPRSQVARDAVASRLCLVRRRSALPGRGPQFPLKTLCRRRRVRIARGPTRDLRSWRIAEPIQTGPLPDAKANHVGSGAVCICPRCAVAASVIGPWPQRDGLSRPGPLAAGIWPKVQRAEHSRPLVGLGLAHPRLLAHHTPNVLRPRYDRSAAIYLGLIRGLSAAGCDVLCFTNGAGEDERWLAALRKQVPQPCRANVSFASRCASPKELAQLISRLDAIVAHRLHACILAFAYRVPAVGILWDPKLEAFFQSVQQDDYLIPFAEVSSRRIGPLIIEAIGKALIQPCIPASYRRLRRQSRTWCRRSPERRARRFEGRNRAFFQTAAASKRPDVPARDRYGLGMIIEPVGLVTLLIGLLVVWRGPQFGIYTLTVSCLLGAAAVMKLPALGDANIQPVHVILCCYALTILLARRAVTHYLRCAFPWHLAFGASP